MTFTGKHKLTAFSITHWIRWQQIFHLQYQAISNNNIFSTKHISTTHIVIRLLDDVGHCLTVGVLSYVRYWEGQTKLSISYQSGQGQYSVFSRIFSASGERVRVNRKLADPGPCSLISKLSVCAVIQIRPSAAAGHQPVVTLGTGVYAGWIELLQPLTEGPFPELSSQWGSLLAAGSEAGDRGVRQQIFCLICLMINHKFIKATVAVFFLREARERGYHGNAAVEAFVPFFHSAWGKNAVLALFLSYQIRIINVVFPNHHPATVNH